jgi:hypothetical protein
MKTIPIFLELRDATAKTISLYRLEICKNCEVLTLMYIMFLYTVRWKCFHPNKHLSTHVRDAPRRACRFWCNAKAQLLDLNQNWNWPTVAFVSCHTELHHKCVSRCSLRQTSPPLRAFLLHCKNRLECEHTVLVTQLTARHRLPPRFK